jgi:hypothetical protein
MLCYLIVKSRLDPFSLEMMPLGKFVDDPFVWKLEIRLLEFV